VATRHSRRTKSGRRQARSGAAPWRGRWWPPAGPHDPERAALATVRCGAPAGQSRGGGPRNGGGERRQPAARRVALESLRESKTAATLGQPEAMAKGRKSGGASWLTRRSDSGGAAASDSSGRKRGRRRVLAAAIGAARCRVGTVRGRAGRADRGFKSPERQRHAAVQPRAANREEEGGLPGLTSGPRPFSFSKRFSQFHKFKQNPENSQENVKNSKKICETIFK
jgi:hypothetical protein